ncbi:MAG TPA: SDR family oxidoreductase [Cyclobacteriaceae bacterium]|nr:SDR family oxidoreductase [Cyclobacteriaceae bacterium]
MNIVITGASTGFGKSIAAKFAAAGHRLFISSRNAVKLYAAVEDLMNHFPDTVIKARPFDLSKKEEARGFGQWILDQGAVPDVLVNNAGLFIPGTVESEVDGTLETMIETNLYSAYYLTRAVLPAMVKQKSGLIVNICSVASLQAYPNGGAYSISKYALAGFTKNLREEMKGKGIKVTAIYPGAAYTDSWAKSGIERSRFMEADDVAATIFGLTQLSPKAVIEEIIMRPQLGDI